MTGSTTTPQRSTNSTSTETLDLAGDLDLEGRLSPAETIAVSTEKTGIAVNTDGHRPATLAAEDPESVLIFYPKNTNILTTESVDPKNWSTARKVVRSFPRTKLAGTYPDHGRRPSTSSSVYGS